MKQFLLLVLMLAVPAFASPTALTVQVASETAASLNEPSSIGYGSIVLSVSTSSANGRMR